MNRSINIVTPDSVFEGPHHPYKKNIVVREARSNRKGPAPIPFGEEHATGLQQSPASAQTNVVTPKDQ